MGIIYILDDKIALGKSSAILFLIIKKKFIILDVL